MERKGGGSSTSILNVLHSHHCNISGIQSVAREAASRSLTLPPLADKTMLHLSTLSQQVTMLNATPKGRACTIFSPPLSRSVE
ncbi:hypothetical protein PBY51_018712 [Eleginops maclovinus]|nr:hypothetical protein PBY51_018712 [Eleginops maclovinus]